MLSLLGTVIYKGRFTNINKGVKTVTISKKEEIRLNR
jgi:hypothetical protein